MKAIIPHASNRQRNKENVIKPMTSLLPLTHNNLSIVVAFTPVVSMCGLVFLLI